MNTEVTRRTLLRGALLAPLTLSGLKLAGARPFESVAALAEQTPTPAAGPFTLPPLAYKFDALEPHIDAMTMQIHHDKHHATYVKNLNDAIAKAPELKDKTADELLKMLDQVPESIRTAVRNNAGGHVNHTAFWALMKPGGGGAPTGAIGDGIKGTFGSLENFQTAFNDAGLKRFGSGWVWLVRDKAGKLAVISTPNQDSPLLEGAYPILGNDVWEHAYYLKYQNRRADYLKAWWNVVNWDEVNRRLESAGKV